MDYQAPTLGPRRGKLFVSSVVKWMVPRPGVEPGLEVPETSVMSFSLPGHRNRRTDGKAISRLRLEQAHRNCHGVRALGLFCLAGLGLEHLVVPAFGLGAGDAEDIEHLVMDESVAHQDFARAEIERSAVHVGDASARLLHD